MDNGFIEAMAGLAEAHEECQRRMLEGLIMLYLSIANLHYIIEAEK